MMRPPWSGIRRFSKNHQSSLTLKGGSTSLAEELELKMVQITDIGGDKREFYRPVRLCNTQHALKGQKLLAQGSALGIMAIGKAPCKGKSLINC